MTKYKLTNGPTSIDFASMQAVNNFKLWNPEWADIEAVSYTEEPQPEAVIVPQEIAMWQLRGAVTKAGLKDAVDAALNELPEPNRTLAGIAWEYANNILRNSPTVAFLQQKLNLTDEQVDNLFIGGAAIEI